MGRILIILSWLAAIIALPVASYASAMPATASSPPCVMDIPAEHHPQQQECLDVSCDRCATCSVCQHCSASMAVLGALPDAPSPLEPPLQPFNIRFEHVYPPIDSPPPRRA